MTDQATFQFLNPGWLLLLPPAWWLIWIYSRHSRRQSMWGRVCDPQLLDNMIANRQAWNGSRLLAWTLGMIMTLDHPCGRRAQLAQAIISHTRINQRPGSGTGPVPFNAG